MNLGLLDRAVESHDLANGWTRIWSSTLVNEFRGGYSDDTRNRRSQFIAGEFGAVRHRGPAAGRGGARLPAVPLRRRQPSVGHPRPAANTFRDLDQSSFSLSNTSTWLTGRTR